MEGAPTKQRVDLDVPYGATSVSQEGVTAVSRMVGTGVSIPELGGDLFLDEFIYYFILRPFQKTKTKS